MIQSLICPQCPLTNTTTSDPRIHCAPRLSNLDFVPTTILCSSHTRNPNSMNNFTKPRNNIPGPVMVTPIQVARKGRGIGEERDLSQLGARQMLILCGFGYWVQGFRCFPWLALNFHMAHGLNVYPSTLQLVQHSGNLPMVAKPLYGVLSDALYIFGAHRIPYISIGG